MAELIEIHKTGRALDDTGKKGAAAFGADSVRRVTEYVTALGTVEGALGGFALCALWALTAGSYVFAVDTGVQLAKVLALSLAVAAFSIVGDLTESMFKRLAGVKDSGTVFGAHGGMLDRIDSWILAGPLVYYVIILFFQR